MISYHDVKLMHKLLKCVDHSDLDFNSIRMEFLTNAKKEKSLSKNYMQLVALIIFESLSISRAWIKKESGYNCYADERQVSKYGK